jgi:outer membrane pore protein F
MIKNSVLAVVIPTVLAAGAATAAETQSEANSTLDMYGEASGAYYLSDNDTGFDEKKSGDQSYLRLGLEGKTALKPGLTAYSQLEYDILADSSRNHGISEKTRLAFAGLHSDSLGSIDYGRNFGVIHDATSWTTSVTEFDGDDNYSENWLAGRTSGVVTYRNSDFFGMMEGLNVAVQYQPKTQGDNKDPRYGHGDTWGMSTSYTSSTGLGVTGAYSQGGLTDTQQGEGWGHGKKAEQWAASMKYDANDVYLAATYGETRNATYMQTRVTEATSNQDISGFADKVKNIQLVAQYAFDFGLSPSISYVESKTSKCSGSSGVDLDNAHLAKYVGLGATYDIGDNVSTYVDYKINQIDTYSDTENQNFGEGQIFQIPVNNVVAAGLVYQF